MTTALNLLRSPATIRARCANITAAAEAGASRWFVVHPERLADAATRVATVTRQRYPELRIPYHSRWRHFEAGGVDRNAELAGLLAGQDRAEQARARIDLAVVSVLLDAGAGPQWRYVETNAAPPYTRSEGLGVASFRAFVAGRFSSDPAQPLRVDGAALARLDAATLAELFQVRADNPLVGLDGRAQLLQRLAAAMAAQPAAFGTNARPGGLFDLLSDNGRLDHLPAAALLRGLLDHTSSIWLTGSTFEGQPLGDAWRHPAAGGDGETAGWVPFHKLSQWLVYSLLEPFEWAGVTITERDALTALPEYRNGGLLLDAGVLTLRDPTNAARAWQPSDELVIEWRALTITLIDRLAERVRTLLGLNADELPLACVLEGGTWATGRVLAAELRGGLPPLTIDSDGTVF